MKKRYRIDILLTIAIVVITFFANSVQQKITGSEVVNLERASRLGGATRAETTPSADKSLGNEGVADEPTSGEETEIAIGSREKTLGQGGTKSVLIEINGIKKEGGSLQITDVSYACADNTIERSRQLYETLRDNLREFGSKEENLPDTLILNGEVSQQLTWSELDVKLKGDLHLPPELRNKQDKGREEEPIETLVATNIFLDNYIDECKQVETNPLQLGFSRKPEKIEIPLSKATQKEVFSTGMLPTASCEEIKPATVQPGSPTLTFIFVTDQGFEKFIDGGSVWGNPLDRSKLKELFEEYAEDMIQVPPFNEFRSSIQVLRYKSDRTYTGCGRLGQCDFSGIMSESINGCQLGGKPNIKLIVLHGVAEDYTPQYFLGYAYYNSPYMLALVGAGTLIRKNQYDHYKLRATELDLSVPHIAIHEAGHALHDLDHVMCDGKHNINSPLGICFTSQTLCEQTTSDECDSYYSSVVTKTSKGVYYSGYMGYGYLPEYPFDPGTKYQAYGKKHIPFVHEKTIINWRLMKDQTVCGNDIVEENEDIDTKKMMYPFDKERNVMGYCSSINEPVKETREKYIYSPLHPQTNFERFLLGEGYGLFPAPETIGKVTVNKNNCIINFPCVEKQYRGIDYGIIQSDKQVDCSEVDYRFRVNAQRSSFRERISINERDNTCDYYSSTDFARTKPVFPEDDNNIIVAYGKKYSGGGQMIVTGIMNREGKLYSPLKEFFIQPEYGKLLALKVVDFDPRERVWNYNPERMPVTSFNGWAHPLALIAVFENTILSFRMDEYFQNGFEEIPKEKIDLTYAKAEKVLDISYDDKTAKIIIIYQYASFPYKSVKKLTIPGAKIGQIDAPTLYSDIQNMYKYPASTLGIAYDKTGIISVTQDTSVPFGGYPLRFLQRTPALATPFERALWEEDSPRSRNVYAYPFVGNDNIGRYVFTIVAAPNPTTYPSVYYYTLTRKSLRLENSYPINGLKGTPQSYYVDPRIPTLTKRDKNGNPITALPIPEDNAIFIVKSLDTKQRPAELDQPYAESFDLDIFDDTIYEYYAYQSPKPRTLVTKELVLTKKRNAAGKPEVILYFNDRGEVIETAVFDADKYNIFEVHPTGAGPRRAIKEALTCSESNTGFLAGLNQRVGDQEDEYVLTTGLEGGHFGSGPVELRLYGLGNMKMYGDGDDKLLYSVTIPETIYLRGVQLEVTKSTTQQETDEAIKAYMLGLERTSTGYKHFGREVNFITNEIRKAGPLMPPPNSPLIAMSLSGNQVFMHMDNNEIYTCPLMDCTATNLRKITLPESNTIPLLLDKGVIALQGTTATYIYDRNGLNTFQKKAKYVGIQGKDTYEIIYTEGTKTIMETLQSTSNGLHFLEKKEVALTLRDIDRILARSMLNNQEILVIDEVMQTVPIKVKSANNVQEGICPMGVSAPINSLPSYGLQYVFSAYDDSKSLTKELKASFSPA